MIVGLILLNISVNDLFFFLNDIEMQNLLKIYAGIRYLNELLNWLEKESKVSTKRFSDRNIVSYLKMY